MKKFIQATHKITGYVAFADYHPMGDSRAMGLVVQSFIGEAIHKLGASSEADLIIEIKEHINGNKT